MGPGERKARERAPPLPGAGRYLVRASVSLEKMTYVPQEGKVVYGDSVDTKAYAALDFLALLSTKAYRRKWAAWVKKIWNTDPLVCPRCGEKMSIIANHSPQDLHELYEYECAS